MAGIGAMFLKEQEGLKPVISQLMASLKTLLRPGFLPGGNHSSTISGNEVVIDWITHRVFLSGRMAKLSPTEFRILECLIRNQGRPVNHKQLLMDVWGPAYMEEKGYLKLYICYLRRKIEEDPANPRFILTERGLGYCFAAERLRIQGAPSTQENLSWDTR